MERLLPTGQCWCGCRAKIDLASFFAPGHDKRAESKVIMEVFGGVPQFLKACGYGPDGEDGASTGWWLEHVLRLMRIRRIGNRVPVIIEYPDVANLSGPLRRCQSTLGSPIDLSEGSVNLSVESAGATSGIFVPFVDIASVHKSILTGHGPVWAVRVTGVLGATNSLPPGVEYVALNHTAHVAVNRATR